MQPDQQPTIRERIDTASNCLAFAARCLALSVEMFLHHGFGPRYVHLQALGALAAIFFWPALWPQEDPRPMLVFLAMFLMMSGVARISGLFRREQVHSRYTGRPYLLWLFPKWDELQVKQSIEPLLVFVVAIGLLPVSEPLGCYLLLASAGLAAHVAIDIALEKRRAQELFDTSLEQERVMESFRRMRGD